jgi:hypothetical protein
LRRYVYTIEDKFTREEVLEVYPYKCCDIITKILRWPEDIDAISLMEYLDILEENKLLIHEPKQYLCNGVGTIELTNKKIIITHSKGDTLI